MGSQLVSAWMLTVFIISSVTLGGVCTIPQGQNLYRGRTRTVQQGQDLYRGGALTNSQNPKFNMYRLWNEDAEAQYEKLQFHGTIINLSNKVIGGTGDLLWGKWMPGGSPKFPIASPGTMVFKSQGRASSPSGTTGVIKMYAVNGARGEFKVNFDCPNSGSNKCSISGEIPGLKFTQLSFSGSGGSVASCTMMIENA